MSVGRSKKTGSLRYGAWALKIERASGGAWYEIPLLFCFMFHFFPPMAAGLYNAALFFAVVGIAFKLKKQGFPATKYRIPPLFLGWIALAILIGLSLFQVPPMLRAESWHRYFADFGKCTLLATLLIIHLDSADKVRRILLAGALAALWMLIHCVFDASRTYLSVGELPRQRDYLYWTTIFFPFAMAVYVMSSTWRKWSFIAVVGILGLSVLSGFRGAMLSLFVMLLVFFKFARLWRPIIASLCLIAIGIGLLWVIFPEHAAHTLYKLQQTDSSGRWASHWLPAWELSKNQPFLGHGFGHQVFGTAVHEGLGEHPEWLPKGGAADWQPSSPHSVVFELMFSAGWLSVVLYFLISLVICVRLLRVVWKVRFAQLIAQPWLMLSLVTLIVYLGEFLVFYQFEAPSWRSMPVFVALAAVCLRAVEQQGKGLE